VGIPVVAVATAAAAETEETVTTVIRIAVVIQAILVVIRTEENTEVAAVDTAVAARSVAAAEAILEEATVAAHTTRLRLPATILTRRRDVSTKHTNLTVNPEDVVAVKIRGLPYQVRYSEINDFFRQFRYIEKSAILGVGGDGRKNGYGSLLFESPEEAAAAAEELDQATIGTRYVELSVISYGDYLNFNGPTGGSGGGYGGGKTTRLSNYVSSETEHRALVMRGLPYRIEVGEIMTFFDGFGSLTADDIYIEEQNGRRTGSCLVLFESESVA
jgi:hypothetical protein